MSHPEEKRQLGALLAVHRQFKGAHQLLVIPDEYKTEVAAGFETWSLKRAQVLGLPGGGRQQLGETPETVHQTLVREAEEELKVVVNQFALAVASQQVHPFLVAQYRPQRQVIDQFGVTTLHVDIDAFDRSSKAVLDKRIQQQSATWINTQDILRLVTAEKGLALQLGFRPQVLVAAWMWQAQLFEKKAVEEIAETVNDWNQHTHSFVQSESQRLGVPVNNGAFNEQGLVDENLSSADQAFLLPTARTLLATLAA